MFPLKSIDGININNLGTNDQAIYIGQVSACSGTKPVSSGYLADALAFIILFHFYFNGLKCQLAIINRINRDEKYIGVRGEYSSGWNNWKSLV